MAQTAREHVDLARAEAAMRRSLIRLKVAKRRRRPRSGRPGQGPAPGAAA
jgi:hypothetical protein